MSSLLELGTHVSDFIGKLPRYASHPENPEDGDMYYNTTGDIIYRYNTDDGAFWEGIKLS